MQSARTHAIPSCPVDMAECVAQLEAGALPAKIQSLYLGHVTWTQTQTKSQKTIEHYGVLLGHKELAEDIIAESTFFFADATFKITPRTARNVSKRGAQVMQ